MPFARLRSDAIPFSPEEPPRGSLRRVLDLVLHKPDWLAQFRRLKKTTALPSIRFERLITVGRREGVIELRESENPRRNPGCVLTAWGRELLPLLDELNGLDRLARRIDTPAMILLRRRRPGSVAALVVRRVLRTRGASLCFNLMPEDGTFTVDELLRNASENLCAFAASRILRQFKTQCLIERPKYSGDFHLTEFGLGVRDFVRRLAALDSGSVTGNGGGFSPTRHPKNTPAENDEVALLPDAI